MNFLIIEVVARAAIIRLFSKVLLAEALLTAPADLATYKAAITEALYKGTRRNIESEADPKNAEVG